MFWIEYSLGRVEEEVVLHKIRGVYPHWLSQVTVYVSSYGRDACSVDTSVIVAKNSISSEN